MTWVIRAKSPSRLPLKLLAGVAFAVAVLAASGYAAPAEAQWRGNDNRHYNNGNQYNRGRPHGWNGGYYRPPPVIYGSPYGSSYYGAPRYYAPPPVIYGPGLGFSLQFR